MRGEWNGNGGRGDARESHDSQDAGEGVTSIRRKRSSGPADTAILIGLCVLGIVLGNLQNGSRASRRADQFEIAIRAVIEPIAAPMAAGTKGISYFTRGLFSARNIAFENARLKELLKHQEMYDAEIAERDEQISRLRTFMAFPPVPGKTRVPASICGFSRNENRFILNVGSKQGVRLGCPVECADGLVGTVEEIEPAQCQVLLLTSAGLQTTSEVIGAKDISRNPPQVGVVRGENAGTLSMTFLDMKAPAQIGDLVVTTGFSDKIPPGLVIGRVFQIEVHEELGALKARLTPSFEPGKLDVVYVLI